MPMSSVAGDQSRLTRPLPAAVAISVTADNDAPIISAIGDVTTLANAEIVEQIREQATAEDE